MRLSKASDIYIIHRLYECKHIRIYYFAFNKSFSLQDIIHLIEKNEISISKKSPNLCRFLWFKETRSFIKTGIPYKSYLYEIT